MSSFKVKEQFVANFEALLQSVGMQDSDGTDTTKPKYWRGQVNDTSKDLFLMYSVTDNIAIDYADNKAQRRQLYINGQLFTRSGFGDYNFQTLANAIETACENAGMFCTFDTEGRDNSIDTESPIYYVNFEIEQRLYN